MDTVLRVATRTSPLALRQVQEFSEGLKRFYPDMKLKPVGFKTSGDKDKLTPISEVEGSDFFTKEIDDAILKGDVDLAVHSAKDLPDRLKDGLTIAAITVSVDIHDVLVSKNGLRLDELSPGAKIGTSSLRRKTQLKRYRNDFQIVDIRGNIEQRLEELYSSDLDAILIAAAGLIRLGLADKITQWLPLEIIQPHPLQGALAVVAREKNSDIVNLLRVLDTREQKGERDENQDQR